jgi:PAS domain S-box-containing protein
MTAPSTFAEIFLTFFEKSMDAVLVFESTKRILAASPSACTLLGIPHAELIGASVGDLAVETSGHEERWARIQAGESVRSEILLTRPDGSRTAVESVVTPDVLPGAHVSVFRDIGERRERELLSERYELLARHTHDIVLFIDEAGLIVEANEAAERAYGLSRVALVGLPLRELRASPTLTGFDAQLAKAFATGVLFETEHRRKDGTTFAVEVGSRSAMVGGRRMLLSIVRDITERRLIQARLVQADRLGAFGMIAAGVAHEINTPLAYALNNLEMLARRVPLLVARLAADGNEDAAEEMAQIQQMLTTAREGIDRVRNITADLKTFSRPGNEHVGGVDVREILESAVNITRGDIRHRAVLVRDYGDVATVRANPPRLGQVFLNLLLNAAQATAVGRTRPAEIEIVTRMDGDTVVVEVNDDGVGIPAALGDRIFEPFVTSKPEGTGLGLYIARSTVREHGGNILIVARPAGGTSIHVRLPGSERLLPDHLCRARNVVSA